jgi:hypothetical protein
MFDTKTDPARDSASTPTLSPRSPQAMANDRKRGFLSSLFGSRKPKEDEDIAELESKHRLEERIQQMLAEKAAVPELLKTEEKPAALALKEEEAEIEVELLPISASVVSVRKVPVPSSFLLTPAEALRSYASNER